MKVLYQSQGYLPPGLLLVGEGPLRQQHEELARSRHARTEFSGLIEPGFLSCGRAE